LILNLLIYKSRIVFSMLIYVDAITALFKNFRFNHRKRWSVKEMLPLNFFIFPLFYYIVIQTGNVLFVKLSTILSWIIGKWHFVQVKQICFQFVERHKFYRQILTRKLFLHLQKRLRRVLPFLTNVKRLICAINYASGKMCFSSITGNWTI